MRVLVTIHSARGRLVTESVDADSSTDAACAVMQKHSVALRAFPFAALNVSAEPYVIAAQTQAEGSKAA